MSYKITTALEKILNMDSRIKIVRGATYSGKTFDIILILIDKGISNAANKTKWKARVVAETVPAVKDGALNIFKELMELMGLWHDDSYNGTDRIYYFSNISYIKFTAYDTVGKSKQAGKWDVTFINEVNHGNELIYNEVISRTDSDVWVDYNPDALFWVDTDLATHPEASMLTLTYLDNEATPESKLIEFAHKRELAKTSKYWENWCRVYLDGLPGTLEGVVIKDFNILPELPKEAKLIAHGVDWGWTDQTAIVSKYKYNGGTILHQVCYQSQLSVNEIAEILKSLPKAPILTDTNVPILNDHLKSMGINVLKIVKGQGSVEAGLELIKQDTIFVTASSVELIEDLRQYRLVDGNYFGRHHGIDAARYTYHKVSVPKTTGAKIYRRNN